MSIAGIPDVSARTALGCCGHVIVQLALESQYRLAAKIYFMYKRILSTNTMAHSAQVSTPKLENSPRG